MAELKVSELTVDEFRMLIREAVTESLADLFADPDEGLELREEFEAELRLAMERRLSGRQETQALQDVLHRVIYRIEPQEPTARIIVELVRHCREVYR